MVVLLVMNLHGVAKLENLRNALTIAFLVSIIFISILGYYFAKRVKI